MSGGTDKIKVQRVDRENYIHNLKTYDTSLHLKPTVPLISIATITPAQFVHDLRFNPATPNAVTVTGTLADLFNALIGTGTLPNPGAVIQMGSQWTIQIQNTDLVNPKVITLPAGFTPATLAVPANSYNEYTFEITSTAPALASLVFTLNNSPAGPMAVSSFNGRIGAVVPVTGDYTDQQIDHVIGGTTNANLNNYAPSPAQVFDIENYLAQYAPGPIAQTTFGGPQAIPKNVWTPVTTTGFLDNNDTFTPPIFVAGAGPNGIRDNGGGATHYVGISLQVSISPAVFIAGDTIGVRVRNGAGIACSNIIPADLTGAAQLVMVVQNPVPAGAGATFTVEVLNQTALTNINCAGVFLNVHYLGPQ